MAGLSANHQRQAGLIDQADLKVGLYDPEKVQLRSERSAAVA
jgi:hypothetical protein